MPSALQAELRFSQVITSNCRQCARRQSSRTRSFHTSPRFRAPQDPSNNASPAAGPGIGDDASRRAELDDKLARQREEMDRRLSNKGHTVASIEPASEDAAPITAPNFYGSASKRRMRSRMLKEGEPEYTPPQWFVDGNICLYGENALAVGARSRVHKVAADLITGEPLDQHLSPSSDGGPSRPSGDGNSHPNSVKRSSPGHEGDLHSEIPKDADKPPPAPQTDGPFQRRYYVLDEQYEEVARTARGLLQIQFPQSRPQESEMLREHLLIRYAGKDGDLLLEHVVEDLARDLGCDLVVLDAQDIASLITQTAPEPRIANSGRMLSYDVYTDAFSDPSSPGRLQESKEEDDDDEDILDDFEGPPTSSMGMPVLIGKPFLDLKSVFGSSDRRPRSDIFGRQLSRLFSDSSSSSRSSLKSQDRLRETPKVIPGLLTAMSDRQKLKTRSDLKDVREYTAKQNGLPKDAVIIHVKDLESIQDTTMGNVFLQGLYKHVSERRKTGTPVLLVGTDTLREGQEPFTQERIKSYQQGDREEISQNIIITPVLPNTTSKLALLHDRKQRIATINMRHLWEFMQYQKPSIFAHLPPGFWQRDFFNHLARSDRSCLEAQIWPYSYVQRLGTYIAGAAPAIQNIPGITDKEELQESLAAVQGLSDPVISAATAHLNHSDKTKMRWAEKNAKEVKAESPDRQVSKEDPRLASIRAGASKYEKRLMGGIIEAKNITTTFNDVHMPVETIDTLQTLTTLSLIRPDAFKYGVLASDKIPGLLLYGPPGTGKTLAAKAVAKESGATMLEVSAADINDMYVGEGEKNVKALFGLAKKLSPCVVFLDEADAMFSARSNQGRRVSHRELLNQFLKEWDGMSNDSGSAFIMVATNRPMDLDDAVLRRLPRRLLVDLPTEPDRLEILKIHLRHEQLADDVDIPDLAKRTPFYSGSDLKNVAVAAAMNCVREENDLARRHQGEEPYKHAERRTLTKQHFDKALEDISASISEDMTSLKDIKKFDEQYGDKRGKKKKVPKLGFPTRDEDAARDTRKVRD
ncbi:hypothetical protein LTR99_008035 [Exophiala xenobiotica]|uniref:AAA+ ATPase domain-containing protein n=1 Tax=Vermiconidia calcicola TaxID=1690605 RepID=A0AAV9PVA9_9PEZI|nr:hypothetical protein LTR96_008432 [Exophiala xenobiotica]KAK5527812.1 hypothetical protein LTR25_010855 [Vermiconidia calcicola]KAK5528309.1 hypothetical protein LTR23_011075 [Chaetothyriales sp. CCFEE 6169]KAK5297633.1 hypothetical protein LTR99_008035 [Exophiala xenobiotica]KAK5335289.1 hypothetical protein LTR98_008288 [Exophiala xenobiotica]